MKVLLIAFDIFSKNDDLSFFYKKIIENNKLIFFYYFLQEESLHKNRPQNVNVCSLKKYNKQVLKSNYSSELINAYIHANEIALSVEGHFFDVVEMNDSLFGIFIRAAFVRYNVKFNTLALLLYDISNIKMDSFENFGSSDGEGFLKKMNYLMADIRYSFNDELINYWKKKTNISAVYFSAMNVFSQIESLKIDENYSKPQIWFCSEGFDYEKLRNILDGVWFVGKKYYEKCFMSTKTVTEELNRFVLNRSIEIEFLPYNADNIDQSLEKKVFFNCGSSENLFHIELLFLGYIVIFNKDSQASKLLKKELMHINFNDNDKNAIHNRVQEILINYELYHKKTLKIIRQLKNDYPLVTINQIYHAAKSFDNDVVFRFQKIFKDLLTKENVNQNIYCVFWKFMKKVVVKVLKVLKIYFIIRFLRKITVLILYFIKFLRKIISIILNLNNRFLSSYFLLKLKKIKKLILMEFNIFLTKMLREDTIKKKQKKLDKLLRFLKLVKTKRIILLKEIARLERSLNHPIKAVCYDMRIIRLLGNDKYKRLPIVIKELESLGFKQEALVVAIMYGNENNKDYKLKEILLDRYQKMLKLPSYQFEFIDDNRKKDKYRVSIIVSLYNASKRLKFFISQIANQTLLKKNEAELIFVETGSTQNDYEVFKEMKKNVNISMVYARTIKRETIQSAWNRGISLTKGEYFCFLGVDEFIIPDALEVLSHELDSDKSVDWIQADSLILEVDNDGNVISDILQFNRTDYEQELSYLDICYLVWVGALYRKSIHDRFGYYDSTCFAAGDSEFKFRLMPYIKTKYYPGVLGYYYHYPEGQSSLSPIGEIEDYRAVHINKSLGGIDYAFNKKSQNELEAFFFKCLKYRKAMASPFHFNSDISFAKNILEYIKTKYPNSNILKYDRHLKKYLRLLEKIELSNFSYFNYSLKRMTITNFQDFLTFYKDNRYLDHSFIWDTK